MFHTELSYIPLFILRGPFNVVLGGRLSWVIILLTQRMNILSILCIKQLILMAAFEKQISAEITGIHSRLYPAFEMTLFNKYVSYLKCSFQPSCTCDLLD